MESTALIDTVEEIERMANMVQENLEAARDALLYDEMESSELIRKRERSLKGAARAKLSRTKEFDHSKWVGGGMLDYRFSNARRIVNDIYAGEVSADV